jgi:hypothetical protein
MISDFNRIQSRRNNLGVSNRKNNKFVITATYTLEVGFLRARASLAPSVSNFYLPKQANNFPKMNICVNKQMFVFGKTFTDKFR